MAMHTENCSNFRDVHTSPNMMTAEEVAFAVFVIAGAAALMYVFIKKYYALLYDYQFEPNVNEEGDPLPLGQQVDAVKERLRQTLPLCMQGYLDFVRNTSQVGNTGQSADVEFVLTVHIGEPMSANGQIVDIACTNMGGDELACVRADLTRPVSVLWSAIRTELRDEQATTRFILSDGRALDMGDVPLSDALAGRTESVSLADALGGEGEGEGEEEDEEEEEEDGLCWSGPEGDLHRHLVTKAMPDNPNFDSLSFTPKQLLPKPWNCVFSGTAQEVFDIAFQRFLHMASASILLNKGITEYNQGDHGTSQLAMIVCGSIQFVAIILTVFWQITGGVAYQDGYSPNLFGTCIGLDINPSRPTLSEAWDRGKKALGSGALKKIMGAVRKVARRGGIYTQEWLAYYTPMVKLEGTWATIATCIGFCHFADQATDHQAGGCLEHSSLDFCTTFTGLLCTTFRAGMPGKHIILPLGCLWLSAMNMASLSMFSNVADRTGDTYQWCKFEVFKLESNRDQALSLKRLWRLYMVAYNLSMLSGLSVASFYLGPLLTFILFCPVIIAYFHTHAGIDFRQLGYRLYVEYLCVPACFLMPGGDRGHSPFGVIMRPVSPRRIYLAQCWFLVSTRVLSGYLHVSRGVGGGNIFVDSYNATTENMEQNIFPAHDRHPDIQSFASVDGLLDWDWRGPAKFPLVEYLFPIWAFSSFVTVSGIIYMLITMPDYMSGGWVDMDYRSQQMDAADSIEGWANTQDRIWEKFERAKEAHDRRSWLLGIQKKPHRD